MPDKNFDPKQPHAKITDIQRQTENGEGSVTWTFQTDYSLKELLGDGFFHAGGNSGLQRLDFIDVWTECNSTTPTFVRLAVTKSIRGLPVEVAQLGEPMKVKTPEIPWYGILGVHKRANAAEIKRAYEEMVDKAGRDKKQKDRILMARDQGLLLNAETA